MAADQLMEELLAAVQDCDLQEIEACLDAGASVSSPGLIHECVSTDDLQIVTALLSRGAQVNQRDADGRTPLHCAQSRGVAEVLLRAGADVRARDANGLTPVEERRAFGVRGLNEVADFIASWRGKTDLRPRDMDEILKEESAIRDEISRLQSAVSQMSTGIDVVSPPSPDDGHAETQDLPTAASLQREEYARARGLPSTATWDQITAHDAAQRRPTVTKTTSQSPTGARTAGETSPPAFHSRDRLPRSPPPSERQVSGHELEYDFKETEASALSTGTGAKEDTSPFAARTELPRSPHRHNSSGSRSFSEAFQATDEDRSSGAPSAETEVHAPDGFEPASFRTRSTSLQRSDSGGGSPGSARGIGPPRSTRERERLLATVEALAATEAEVQASVEEAEAAAAEAEARSIAAAARADAARKRARLEARRAAAGFGNGGPADTGGGLGHDSSSSSRRQLGSTWPPPGRDRSGSGDGKVMIPTDLVELLRSCTRSEVMLAAHRRISENEMQRQNWHGEGKDAVLGTYSAFFRFVAQLTQLQRSSDQSTLWEMLWQTVDSALPHLPRRTGSTDSGGRRQSDDYKRSASMSYAVDGSDRTGSFGESSRTGSGGSDSGTSVRSRSAIDDSSAARRAELRRLTQNLVTSATDRTAAALRESGLSLGTFAAASPASATGRSYSNAGGLGTTRASVDAVGITWRTPGGLEYSISPPARTGSSGSDGGSSRQLTLGGVTSPSSRLRSPPMISSAERVQRQHQRTQQHQEHSSPDGSLSPPIERATAAVAASASALRSVSPKHRRQSLSQEQLPQAKIERQPVTPTPGKAWIDIEETPLRPPPTRDAANSSGYSAVIGGPNDDPFAGPKLRGPDADPTEEQRAGDGGSSGGDDADGESISVSQLRSNIQQHLDPSSSPFDTDNGTPGGYTTVPEESEQLSAKREKVLQIRRERELAKQ